MPLFLISADESAAPAFTCIQVKGENGSLAAFRPSPGLLPAGDIRHSIASRVMIGWEKLATEIGLKQSELNKERDMTICPIALLVHCVGCPLVKICPGKSIVGDFETYEAEVEQSEKESEENP